MILFAVRRAGAALLVAWLALTLAFVVLRALPGDAVDATLTHAGIPPEALDARRAELGLNDSLWKQYLDYAAGAARGT
jgi:peptide/nickel transport system permease protein